MIKSPFAHLAEHQAEHKLMKTKGYGFIAQYLFSQRPTALAFGKGYALITDVGVAPGTLMYSDGVTWGAATTTLLEIAVPLMLPSSGTFGNNGALSGIAATDTALVNGYLYFPAGAIFAGSAAGLYYTVMSSTTAGTVYNNVYSGLGQPTIPASPTPFVCTGPGAYTQTSAVDILLCSVNLPANCLGTQSKLSTNMFVLGPTNANTKTWSAKLAATAIFAMAVTTSTYVSRRFITSMMGKSSRQVTSVDGLTATTVANFVTTNVATNVDVLWGFYAKIPAGTESTDYLLLDHLSVEATLIP
jgi:hypothetical protein